MLLYRVRAEPGAQVQRIERQHLRTALGNDSHPRADRMGARTLNTQGEYTGINPTQGLGGLGTASNTLPNIGKIGYDLEHSTQILGKLGMISIIQPNFG